MPNARDLVRTTGYGQQCVYMYKSFRDEVKECMWSVKEDNIKMYSSKRISNGWDPTGADIHLRYLGTQRRTGQRVSGT